MQNEDCQVLIIDTHELVREGLKSVLGNVTWASVVAEAETAEGALDALGRYSPNVAVVDICLPSDSGVECLRKLRALDPELKLLVLTDKQSQELVYQCLEAGANGFMIKDTSCRDIVTGLQAVVEGGTYLSPGVLAEVTRECLEARKAKSPSNRLGKLTRREREVFEMVGAGLKNREIGEQLFISIKTVEKHRANMMRKLQLRSPAEVRELYASQKD